MASRKKFSSGIKFRTFFKSTKYEIKYRTKICTLQWLKANRGILLESKRNSNNNNTYNRKRGRTRPLARGQKVSRHTSGWSRRSPQSVISLYLSQKVLFSLNTFGRAFEFVARCTSRLSLSNTVERARSAAISPNSWWKKLSVDTKLSLVGRGQADSGSFGTLLCAFYLRKSRSVSWPLFSISQTPIFESLWDVWASASYFRCGWRPLAEKVFLGVSSAFRQQVQRLGPSSAARPIDCNVNSYEK